MSKYQPIADYRYQVSAYVTPTQQVENRATDAQRLVWAREDAASAKAARDAHEPDFNENNPNLMPLDPSANPARSDAEWYRRRGE
jgi:hypothetical protein